jgi:hypothetical protein
MPKIEKLSVTWNGLLLSFAELVHHWGPPALKNETAYRDHLLTHIRDSVPADTKLEREFRHHGTTIDIWLRWSGLVQRGEIAFELKVNLKKKTEFDRLVGQVESLDPRNNNVLLVLIGETDQSLLGRLREKYASQITPPIGTTATLAIVEVPVATNAP